MQAELAEKAGASPSYVNRLIKSPEKIVNKTFVHMLEKLGYDIESAKERTYRKVNEELILMYRDVGEYISKQSERTEYGDAFVQKLADFFAENYPDLKGVNRRGLYRMKQFYGLYKDNEKVSTLLTQLS